MYLMIISFLFQAAVHDGGDGDFFRVIPILGFALAATLEVINNRVPLRRFHPRGVDGFIVIFFVLSAIPLVIDSTIGPVLYAFLFMLTAYALLLCVVAHGIDSVVDAFLIASAIALVLAIITDYSGLIDALLVTRSDSGLLRYMALGAHPNLVGHNFAMAAVISFYRFIYCKVERIRYVYFVSSVIFLIMPLAASSRGSLLAFSVSFFAGLMYLVKWHEELPRNIRWILKMVPFVAIAALFFTFSKLDYVIDLLELNTDSRGFDSGMTGRGDNWLLLIDEIFSSPRIVFFGAGLRTWIDDVRGYATDSSYLNMMWEVGLPATIVSLFVPLRVLFTSARRRPNSLNFLVILVFVFMFVEGFFARYFYGIGNPASTLFLAILLSVSHYELFVLKIKTYA
jgi:hypothetical protein